MRPIRPSFPGLSRRVPLLAGALLLALPAAATAQDGFLFRPPMAGITVRAGPMMHTAGGDLFGQLRRDLTLDRQHLATAVLGVDVVVLPTARVDLVFSIAHARASHLSEFRDFVDQDDLPIEQTTRLTTTPASITVRYQLRERGRRLGQTAWVPSATTPYIGGGAGIIQYRLEHWGEFIDFQDYSIFHSSFATMGHETTLHVLAGADHWLSPRVGLNAEARYTRGSARPDDGFRSFRDLDLGGLQATVGLTFRW
ncbi:MAG TPA: hypothetical protein VK929_02375 [Longimicrobiales bacterium]|nr:hypothetical protein [Longimicrobiales bacterium]